MVGNKSDSKKGREGLNDTIGRISYSLVAEVIVDYASGLRGPGIIASRTYGTALNVSTGAWYGKWRNLWYRKTRTTDQSSKARKYLVELVAFNTFQVPVYATVIAVGSLVSNLSQGQLEIDFKKIEHGTKLLFELSPLIGPTAGLWTEGIRKVFNREKNRHIYVAVDLCVFFSGIQKTKGRYKPHPLRCGCPLFF